MIRSLSSWLHLRNRSHIFMDRYHYFASTYRAFGYDIPDEREHDGSLAVVLSVLRCVHQRFFNHDCAGVRELIAEVRRQVLPGCTVAFNFLEQVMPKTTHGLGWLRRSVLCAWKTSTRRSPISSWRIRRLRGRNGCGTIVFFLLTRSGSR